MLLCCLMQGTTLRNKMHYYSHNIITENQTNYVSYPLPIGYLVYSSIFQNDDVKSLYLTHISKFCALVGSNHSPIADYK